MKNKIGTTLKATSDQNNEYAKVYLKYRSGETELWKFTVYFENGSTLEGYRLTKKEAENAVILRNKDGSRPKFKLLSTLTQEKENA